MDSADSELAVSDEPSILRAMLRIAWPVLAEQSLTMLVGFSDTFLAGQYLSADHLAAMSLVAYSLWLLTSFFTAVDIGALALVARAIGARDYDLAGRVVSQAYLAGAGIAVAVTAIGVLWGDAFVAVMQLEPAASKYASQYLWILLPVLPLVMCQYVGAACLRGAGDTLPGFLIMIVVNVVNVAVSWSLMLGLGPLPKLGWMGLAVGTATGFAIGGLLTAGLLIRGRASLRLTRSVFKPDFDLIRRLFRIGLPGGGDVMTIIACQFWFLSIINSLGSTAAAAHGIAIRLESLAYLPGTAFQVAAAAMAGQSLGAGDQRRAIHSVLVACGVGGVVMSVAGVILYTMAMPLSGAFLGEGREEIQVLSATVLRIISWAMPGLAIAMVLSGALRGAGDTRWPLVFTVLGFVGVRIPLAYLVTGPLGWGLVGAWYTMVIDLYFRCSLVVWRFLHGGWTRIKV